jgi:hypothetical protein
MSVSTSSAVNYDDLVFELLGFRFMARGHAHLSNSTGFMSVLLTGITAYVDVV